MRSEVSPETIAIVPVKGLATAKSRLAGYLTLDERAELVVRLLDRVLLALAGSGCLARCFVVTPEPAIRERAIRAGVQAVDEPEIVGEIRSEGQNSALERARRMVMDRDPAALLVLSADLPLLKASEVRALVARGRGAPGVVIAPDRQGRGTNALFLRPPDAIPFQFGPDSYLRHRREAEARGLAVHVFRARGTAFDVDVPQDLNACDRSLLARDVDLRTEDAQR